MKVTVVGVSKMEFDNKEGQHICLFRHTCVAEDKGQRQLVIVNSRSPYPVNAVLTPEFFIDSKFKLGVRLVEE